MKYRTYVLQDKKTKKYWNGSGSSLLSHPDKLWHDKITEAYQFIGDEKRLVLRKLK